MLTWIPEVKLHHHVMLQNSENPTLNLGLPALMWFKLRAEELFEAIRPFGQNALFKKIVLVRCQE
jgi:hypothetical protein